MSFLHDKNIIKTNNDLDKKFLDDYYYRYQKILFDSRDDNSILKLRNAIYETHLNNGKLIFIGNGASASLASHAATDFTKQAKIPSIAFNDHNLITACLMIMVITIGLQKLLSFIQVLVIWLYL